jgi:hypothetical protein
LLSLHCRTALLEVCPPASDSRLEAEMCLRSVVELITARIRRRFIQKARHDTFLFSPIWLSGSARAMT